MFSELIINLFITVAVISFSGQVLRDKPITYKSPLSLRMLIGVGAGILGMLLINYSIEPADNIFIDLRHISIMISALYGGIVSSFICAICISIFRVVLTGINTASAIAVFMSFLMATFCGIISFTKLSRYKKYILMNIFNVASSSFSIYTLLKKESNLTIVMGNYFVICFLAIVAVYFVTTYTNYTNRTYREMSYFKFMADNLSDLVSTHLPDGTFLYLSSSCENLLGYDPKELVGTNPYRLFHPSDLPEIEKFYNTVITSRRPVLITYRIQKRDKNYLWFETTTRNALNKDGSIKELVCVSRDISERKTTEQMLLEANDKLSKLSYIDGLTEIANRRYFDEFLTTHWNEAINNTYNISLLILDIDYFKKYNDAYGHLQGDECLKKVAKTLKEITINTNYLAARYGGEEFALVLPKVSQKEALAIGERLRQKVESLGIPHKDSLIKPFLTISIGISSALPINSTAPDKLIHESDLALYKSKSSGRNKVMVFEEEINKY